MLAVTAAAAGARRGSVNDTAPPRGGVIFSSMAATDAGGERRGKKNGQKLQRNAFSLISLNLSRSHFGETLLEDRPLIPTQSPTDGEVDTLEC